MPVRAPDTRRRSMPAAPRAHTLMRWPHHPTNSRLIWRLRRFQEFVQTHFEQIVDTHVLPLMADGDAATNNPAAALPPGTPLAQHPAGISKNWSLLYVWLQYAQWYKVLCWLMVLVLGGSEGLLPSSVRAAFQVEELLLASDVRAQVFIFGQCVPFVLTKARHFLVTWTGSSWLVRLVFYSLFTSHVEVAATLICDALVACHLLYDWESSASNDYLLRLNLNRLRSGYFAIASLRPIPTRTATSNTYEPVSDSTRPHAE